LLIKSNIFLITGAAGFIGFHVSLRLLSLGARVIGYDNVNEYYDVALKEARLNELKQHDCFSFVYADLADTTALHEVFSKYSPPVVIHLAAQAGVRYSLENPDAYVQSNLVGFVNILECCRHYNTAHLLYASSSSVYGASEEIPFSVDDRTDKPISLYAATKKSNELFAYTYSHLFGIPTTGMRFFTVYGPWGRPDMAPYLFLESILQGRPIKVFNNGAMMRDFTYIDDVVNSVISLINNSFALKQKDGQPPYKVYNIGNNRPEKLLDFIAILEELTGKKAIMEFLPLQSGDVIATFANIDELVHDTGIMPETLLRDGLAKFVTWRVNK